MQGDTLQSQRRPLSGLRRGSTLCVLHLTKLPSNSDKERKSQGCLWTSLGLRRLEPTHTPAK